MDPEGNPLSSPEPVAAAGSAPKKGLQVQLPDDDPPPPPPKPKVVAAPAKGGKGRRGNWWDEKTEPRAEEPEPPAAEPPPSDDDAAGATAMLQLPRPAQPARRRAPPREAPPEPEPEPEPEQPTLQRRGRSKPVPLDSGATQMLDLRNVPTPEEIRQQIARQAKASTATPDAPPSGWTATRVFIVLAALAVVFGLVAAALALLK